MHTGISTIRDLLLAAALAAAGHASAATHYAFTLPDPEPSYTSTYMYVTALDDTNAVDTSYAGTAVVTSSDPGLAVIGPLTFAAGVLEFHIAFKKAGLQSVTLTDNANASITGTTSTTVVPGPPTHFSVDGAAPAAGAAMPSTVNARDLFENLATSYSGTVHITGSDAQATHPADFAITAGTGAASATFRRSLAQMLTATDTADAGMTGTGRRRAGDALHVESARDGRCRRGVQFRRHGQGRFRERERLIRRHAALHQFRCRRDTARRQHVEQRTRHVLGDLAVRALEYVDHRDGHSGRIDHRHRPDRDHAGDVAELRGRLRRPDVHPRPDADRL